MGANAQRHRRPFAGDESAIHGSDLAAATGQDSQIPDDLADATSKLTAMLYSDPANRPGEFAAAIAVLENATPSDKAVAFLRPPALTGRYPLGASSGEVGAPTLVG